MSDSNDLDVFAKWRSKQPRKLFRVFYNNNTYDVLVHTESEVHEHMQIAMPDYKPQLARIKSNDV